MGFISRPLTRLAMAAGAAVFALVAGVALSIQGPSQPNAAWADTPVTLNPSHVGATAAGFPTKDCTGPLSSPPGPNYDGWHFVLPDSSGESFTSITITFSGLTAGPITALSPATNSGPGWVGFLDDTGSGDVKHAYIFTTPPGMSIVAGIATVTPDEATPGTFNLSHTCPTASPSPSPSPSTSTSPSVSPSASVSPSPSMSTSRPPRPTPSRTKPGYGYGYGPQEPVRDHDRHESWWQSLFS